LSSGRWSSSSAHRRRWPVALVLGGDVFNFLRQFGRHKVLLFGSILVRYELYLHS